MTVSALNFPATGYNTGISYDHFIIYLVKCPPVFCSEPGRYFITGELRKSLQLQPLTISAPKTFFAIRYNTEISTIMTTELQAAS